MSRTANLKIWAAALLAAVAAAAMVVALGFTSPAQAANAGDLDRSFSGDGRVTFDVFGEVLDSGHAVAIQPDGKIVVAGSWCGFGAGCSTGTFALARFNPDGSLDTVFGSGGRTLVAFPNGAAEANDVAIQADGKIVAAGWRNDDDGVLDADFALVRLEPDGDLDPSFSGDGKVVTSFGGYDIGYAVAIQDNGKIVVAGWNISSGDPDFAVARYNANGSLDTSFSGDGKQTTGLGDSDSARGVVIQSDGKIVAAGSTYAGGGYFDIALARYNANGSLDTSFDGDGKMIYDLGAGDEYVRAATIQSNDKVIVAGDTDGRVGRDFLLARFNTDGSPDKSFEGGALGTDFGSNEGAFAVAVQPDGRIVAAGYTNGNFALARYHANDGSLDTSFSGDGRQVTGFGGYERVNGVAIQADGRIVAAGTTTTGGDRDFALARYHAITDNTPPNTTITSGPSGAINSTSATFTFVSSETRSTFQCSLDRAAFSGCSSPKSYSNLIDGRHIFRVRAIDAAGNTDQTPAQRSFIVDTIAPKVNSVVPAESATGVSPAVNVRATFPEAMSASSINTNTVQLFRAGTTTPIAAVVSYDTGTKTATLNPDANLRLDTRYKAVVTTATRDLAGNRLDQDPSVTDNQRKKWFFTVRN